MKGAILLLTLFVVSPVSGQLKPDCIRIKDAAQYALANGKLRDALVKLRALKVCDPTLSAYADNKIIAVYDSINRQKENAVKASEAELKAKNIALAAQRKAEAQTAIAEARLKTMVSRKLAGAGAAAQNKMFPEWHLSLLLGIEAMKLGYSQEADLVLRNAMDNLPVLLKEEPWICSSDILLPSPGGKYFAEVGSLSCIRQMNAEKYLFQVHCGSEASLLFSADENILITGSDSNHAKIIQLPEGKLLDSLVHQQTYVELLAISDDKHYLATRDYDTDPEEGKEGREEIMIWDLHTRKIIQRISPSEVISRALFKRIEGGHVFITGAHSSEIWKIGAGKTNIPEKHPGLLTDDGNYWLVKSLRGFSLNNFADNKPLFGGDTEVKEFRMSKSGKYLMISNSVVLQVWDIRRRNKYEIDHKPGYRLNAEAAIFSNNDKYFSFTHSSSVWDTYTGNMISTNFWSEGVKAVRAGNSYETSRRITSHALEQRDPAFSAFFSPTGDTMYTLTEKGIVHHWLTAPGNATAAATVSQRVTGIYSSADHVLYISDYLGVYKWPWRKGLDTLLHVRKLIQTMTLNEKSGLLAYSGEDLEHSRSEKGIGTLNLLNGDTGFIPLIASIKTIDIDPSGKFLLAGTTNDIAENVETGLWIIDLHSKRKKRIDSSQLIYHKAFFWRDADKVLFVGEPEMMLKDLKKNVVLFREKFENTNTLYIDRNYKCIAMGNREQLSVYRINKNERRSAPIARHFGGEIISADFSPAGDLMLIGLRINGITGELLIWDLKDNSIALQLAMPAPIAKAVFDRTDPGNIIVSQDKNINVYKWKSADLLKEAERRVIRPLTEEEWNAYVGSEFPFHMKK